MLNLRGNVDPAAKSLSKVKESSASRAERSKEFDASFSDQKNAEEVVPAAQPDEQAPKEEVATGVSSKALLDGPNSIVAIDEMNERSFTDETNIAQRDVRTTITTELSGEEGQRPSGQTGREETPRVGTALDAALVARMKLRNNEPTARGLEGPVRMGRVEMPTGEISAPQKEMPGFSRIRVSNIRVSNSGHAEFVAPSSGDAGRNIVVEASPAPVGNSAPIGEGLFAPLGEEAGDWLLTDQESELFQRAKTKGIPAAQTQTVSAKAMTPEVAATTAALPVSSSIPEGEAVDLIVSQVNSLSRSATTQAVTPAMSSSIAVSGAGVIPQVMAAIRTEKFGDVIEVRLDPPDMGRVRIDFSMESGVAVKATVSAEYRETLEQMRKHSQDLAEQLRQSGFDSVELEFSDRSAHDFEVEEFEELAGLGLDGANSDQNPNKIYLSMRENAALDLLV